MSAQKSNKTTKDKLFGLLACGSGKKNRPLSNMENAPEEKPEDSGHIDHSIVNVRAYKGHEYTEDSPMKSSGRNEEEGEDEDGLVELSYSDLKLIGKGTFGVVYRAKLCENGELVAIKKVFDDKRYKNRELVFMRRLQHPNVCDLLYYFYSEDPGCRKGERFLNMVLEYVPKTLFTIAKCDGTFTKPLLDPSYIKVYVYQLLRSLNYLHSMSVCHRDIKPQNMLINPITHQVKLCDFGSAKELLKNESNVAYICSRYYRAPELIFGAKDYDYRIDLWSAGCILAELYLGHPIFPGTSGPDQMVEIMKILGTPTLEDIRSIHHNCKGMVFPPTLVPMPWSKVFTKSIPSQEAINLISRLLVFNPEKRILSLEALAHPFFQQLRQRDFALPDGKFPPPLFNFTPEELENSPTIKESLQPVDWEKDIDENLNNNFSHTPTSPGNENLKSKIVNLARNSLRKASFRRDKHEKQSDEFEVPNAYQFEDSDVEIGGYGGEGDGGYEGGGHHGADEVDDENFTNDIQKLDLNDSGRPDVGEREEEGEKKKKKKKKKSTNHHHHGDEDGGEMPVEDTGLDVMVGDDGGDNEVRMKKKKKKKKADEGGSYEGGHDGDDDAGGPRDAEHDDVIVSSPYGEEGRKKGKKSRVKVSEETTEEVTTHKTRSTRKAKKHRQAEEDEGDVIQNESYVVGYDDVSVEKKKKKKKKNNDSLQNEV